MTVTRYTIALIEDAAFLPDGQWSHEFMAYDQDGVPLRQTWSGDERECRGRAKRLYPEAVCVAMDEPVTAGERV